LGNVVLVFYSCFFILLLEPKFFFTILIERTIIMKTPYISSLLRRFLGVAAVVVLALTLFISEADAQRRGGGSFGGGRSFGGSRSPSYSPSRPASPSGSSMSRNGGSFGGSRPQSAIAGSNYRNSYGVPRQSTPMSVPGASSPYMVHRYGGFSDGLMTGYLMGHTSMMWSMPFHPAFYYSRPVYVTNPTGAVEVYPPTFSFLRFFMGMFIIGGVVFLVVWLIRRRNKGNGYNMSQSSFS
jgi:hypothetical protein